MTTRTAGTAVTSLAVCLLFAGCYPNVDDLAIGPPTVTLSGTWTGRLTDNAQAGNLTLTLSQRSPLDQIITGTWDSTLEAANPITTGTLDGSAGAPRNGSGPTEIQLYLNVPTPSCQLYFAADVRGITMEGQLREVYGRWGPECSSAGGWKGFSHRMTLTRQ